MIIKSITTIALVLLAQLTYSQNKLCESNADNLNSDLNTIGKCAISKFKKSNKEGYIEIATRRRYVRKNKPNYSNTIKDNVKAFAVINKTNKEENTTSSKTNKVVHVSETKVSNNNFIRFDKVTEVPVFITCVNDITDKRECVKETFVNNVLDNLVYPFDAAAAGIEGVVWVRFIIDKEGYIKDITTQASENASLLEEEAKRLISLLPKFIPGKHNSTYVNVEYFMPINFQLDQ